MGFASLEALQGQVEKSAGLDCCVKLFWVCIFIVVLLGGKGGNGGVLGRIKKG